MLRKVTLVCLVLVFVAGCFMLKRFIFTGDEQKGRELMHHHANLVSNNAEHMAAMGGLFQDRIKQHRPDGSTVEVRQTGNIQNIHVHVPGTPPKRVEEPTRTMPKFPGMEIKHAISHLYVTSCTSDSAGDHYFVECVDRMDGTTKWKTEVQSFSSDHYGDNLSPQVCVFGSSVYVATCHVETGWVIPVKLHKLSAKDGSIEWAVDIRESVLSYTGYGDPIGHVWWSAPSISVDSSGVYIRGEYQLFGGSGSYTGQNYTQIDKYNKDSGSVIWSTHRESTGYSYSNLQATKGSLYCATSNNVNLKLLIRKINAETGEIEASSPNENYYKSVCRFHGKVYAIYTNVSNADAVLEIWDSKLTQLLATVSLGNAGTRAITADESGCYIVTYDFSSSIIHIFKIKHDGTFVYDISPTTSHMGAQNGPWEAIRTDERFIYFVLGSTCGKIKKSDQSVVWSNEISAEYSQQYGDCFVFNRTNTIQIP